MKIEEKVNKIIHDGLWAIPKEPAENIKSKVYLHLVDDLPVIAMVDDISTAASVLYATMKRAMEEPIRVTTASDFDGLIIDRIKMRFTKTATISTIYHDFVDCGFTTVCEDDIMRAIDDLTTNEEDWK